MQTFVVKLASGVAALIASICLSICNLNDNTEAVETVADIAASNVLGLRMTMTILPIIGLIMALFVFRKKFILNEGKVEEIAQKLREK